MRLNAVKGALKLAIPLFAVSHLKSLSSASETADLTKSSMDLLIEIGGEGQICLKMFRESLDF